MHSHQCLNNTDMKHRHYSKPIFIAKVPKFFLRILLIEKPLTCGGISKIYLKTAIELPISRAVSVFECYKKTNFLKFNDPKTSTSIPSF